MVMEDFLDYLNDLYDNTIDLLSEFWDDVSEWVSNAWNWLHKFLYEKYEKIKDWFGKLADWAEKQIKKLKGGPVVITNPRVGLGKQIGDAIKNETPITSAQFRNLGAQYKAEQFQKAEINTFSMNGEQIDEMAAFDANVVENPYAFNKLMEEKNGVVVIKDKD